MYRTTGFRYQGNVEWAFDGDDRLIEPGGRQLADSIATALRQQGVQVSEVTRHEDYGWGFESEADGRTFYQVLNAPSNDEIYLTLQTTGSRGATGSHALLEQYCGRVAAALSLIPGLDAVRWEEWRA